MKATPRVVPIPAPRQYINLSVFEEIAIRLIFHDQTQLSEKPTMPALIMNPLATK